MRNTDNQPYGVFSTYEFKATGSIPTYSYFQLERLYTSNEESDYENWYKIRYEISNSSYYLVYKKGATELEVVNNLDDLNNNETYISNIYIEENGDNSFKLIFTSDISSSENELELSNISSILVDNTGNDTFDNVYYKISNVSFNDMPVYANTDLTMFIGYTSDSEWAFFTGTQFDVNYNNGSIDTDKIEATVETTGASPYSLGTYYIYGVNILGDNNTIGNVLFLEPDNQDYCIQMSNTTRLDGIYYLISFGFNMQPVYVNEGFEIFVMYNDSGQWSFCERDQFFTNWDNEEVDNSKRMGMIEDTDISYISVLKGYIYNGQFNDFADGNGTYVSVQYNLFAPYETYTAYNIDRYSLDVTIYDEETTSQITKLDDLYNKSSVNYTDNQIEQFTNSGTNNNINDSSETIVYLEKMLPEDTTTTSVTYDTVADDIDPELRLSNLGDVTLTEAEFAFYVDVTYSQMYIKVYNPSSDTNLNGWLSFDTYDKFIIVSDVSKATNVISYIFDKGFLPTLYPFTLDNDYIAVGIPTIFSTDQMYQISDINDGLSGINLWFESTSSDDSTFCVSNTNGAEGYNCNTTSYDVSFIGADGTSKYNLDLVVRTSSTSGEDYLYVKEKTGDSDDDSYNDGTGIAISFVIYEKDDDEGLYFAVNHNIDTYLDNVWFGLNEDNMFVLVKDVNTAINFYDYIRDTSFSSNDVVSVSDAVTLDFGNANTTGIEYTEMSQRLLNSTTNTGNSGNTGNSVTVEGFTNMALLSPAAYLYDKVSNFFTNVFNFDTSTLESNTENNNNETGSDSVNNSNIPSNNILQKYSIVSNPSNEPSANSLDDCYALCNEDTNVIGLYYDTDSGNCKCYDEVILANTGVETDVSVINYNDNGRLSGYRNTRDVTQTSTVDSDEACNLACQLDSDGGISSTNLGYTYTESKTSDNCTCHNGYDIRPSDGDITGKTNLTDTTEDDYEPLKEYVRTSSIIRHLTSPTNRVVYWIFKIASVIVALLLYSYFAHRDTTTFQIIKAILIILFSELYLVYQVINIMVLKNHRLSHTI